MQTGTVKFFNETKGFGFINNAETGEDAAETPGEDAGDPEPGSAPE